MLASHRRKLPLDAFHVARLAATQVEDCGTCVQIVVNMARKEDVGADLLKAALAGNEAALPAPLGDVLRYARQVAQGQDDAELRDRLRASYGEAGLVELALAIATARVFPSVKRAMGHAVSCSLVRVEV